MKNIQTGATNHLCHRVKYGFQKNQLWKETRSKSFSADGRKWLKAH